MDLKSNLIILAGNELHTSDRDLGGGTIASVVITGLAVVFIALIILIALVWLYGKIFDSLNKKKEKKELAKNASAEPAVSAPVVKAEAARAAAPEVEDGIEEEVVAVITAAIAAYGAQTGKKLAVKSIKASGGAARRNAWSAAGLADATRPF